jgi:hypothetical protein
MTLNYRHFPGGGEEGKNFFVGGGGSIMQKTLSVRRKKLRFQNTYCKVQKAKLKKDEVYAVEFLEKRMGRE